MLTIDYDLQTPNRQMLASMLNGASAANRAPPATPLSPSSSAKPGKIRVAVITNVIPQYRVPFYRRLAGSEQLDVHVFSQDHIPGMALKLGHQDLGAQWSGLHAIVGKHEWIGWQHLPLLHLLKNYDVFVFHGNPRVLSNVVWSLLLRLLGRKVIVWGHGQTFSDNKLAEALRLRWWRCFRTILVYTDQLADTLARGPLRGRHVVGVNNGLDQDHLDQITSRWNDSRLKLWRLQHGLQNAQMILSCARLTSKNDFALGMEAFSRLVKKYPNLYWVVIGDGSEKSALQTKAQHLGIATRILWQGELYDEDELAPWFLSSLLLLHPAAVGLSLMHAFGYGLPVVTHDISRRQMPEIAALENGVNGLLYQPDNPESLAETIERLVSNDELRKSMGTSAIATAQDRFNTNIMVQRFHKAVSCAINDMQRIEVP